MSSHTHDWVDHGLVSPTYEIRLYKCSICTEIKPVRAIFEHTEHNPPSRSNYVKGCECDDCNEANNEYIREWRANNPYYEEQRRKKRKLNASRA